MNHYYHLRNLLTAYHFKGLLQLLRYCLVGIIAISSSSWANDVPDKAINAEQAFMQGQQYIEQADLELAALSLTRIPPNSPYAKLLAGNIAAKNAEFDRTFILLLPLQSNLDLNQTAIASLHASLSDAYEKQGDIASAIEQLVRRHPYLVDAQSISHNQQRVWKLLSTQTPADLIAMRGESADTTIQGWIDLSLATKNHDVATSLSTWSNSYPDHIASAFAKKLATTAPEPSTASAVINGNIALILPPVHEDISERVAAFKLGLQAALSKRNMPNEIKSYTRANDLEDINTQYLLAKSEGADYAIAPNFGIALPGQNPVSIVSLNDNISRQQADLSLQDEAHRIAEFATRNAMQNILILTTANEPASQMLQSFVKAWQTERGFSLKIISLIPSAVGVKDSFDLNQLMDLKANIALQAQDMLLLAMSGPEVKNVRPYLDISMPTMTFSDINMLDSDANANIGLNAIYFVDIPFLLAPNNSQFTDYREPSAALKNNELKRYFALGVDYMQILTTGLMGYDLVIEGLTGKLSLDHSGQIQRQLSVAKFTDQGVVLDK
ncbi:MAG: penicillin-binding protein activator [Methylophilales bacterium]|nr:penicillin-binding protein activator [Methylophilales bacterium]